MFYSSSLHVVSLVMFRPFTGRQKTPVFANTVYSGRCIKRLNLENVLKSKALFHV